MGMNRRGFLFTISGLFCGGLLRKGELEGPTPLPSTAQRIVGFYAIPDQWIVTSCRCGLQTLARDPNYRYPLHSGVCPSCGKSPYYSLLKSRRRA